MIANKNTSLLGTDPNILDMQTLLAQLLNVDIPYYTSQAANENNSTDERAHWVQLLNDAQARAAGIQAWLGLTPHQQATTNPNTYINNAVSLYNQAVNYTGYGTNTGSSNNPSGMNQAGFDLGFLTTNVLGLPLWGWGLGAGVLYYVLKK